MLSYIYRLVRDFEHEHGIHPNLLYLNRDHISHLNTAFSDDYSLQHIMKLLQMELIIEDDLMHPHVVWTNLAQSRIA